MGGAYGVKKTIDRLLALDVEFMQMCVPCDVIFGSKRAILWA